MAEETLLYRREAPLKPVADRRRKPTQRRRSFRAQLLVPVTVKWRAKGNLQEEVTNTKTVNAHGCLVLLRAPVYEGLGIELVNLDSNKAGAGRVVWCGSVEPDGRTQVGIELENPDPRFWGEQYVEFLLWLALQPD
ncbi:MAG TPA: hypothetical protein VJ085_05655 [Candidatus Acidoferrales bacterium]|nr:hypothetical protein [Candidatus Acidoferrales bacterium]